VAAIPEGMTEVSREEFWARVRTETRNIHPSSEKFHTDWVFLGSRGVWGWTSRGYKGPFDHEGAEPERFAIAR
jgi:hypothetical protein